jgi:LPXTG-motif cell wall-anchored protein
MTEEKKQSKLDIALWILAFIGVTGLAVIAWWYLRKKKKVEVPQNASA